MLLDEWAARWAIPSAAIADLRASMGVAEPPIGTYSEQSETAAQQQIRLAESRKGNRVWRNNRGAAYDETGRFIRYGLANDSKAMDKKIKSSDLIGVTPYTITAADVGRLVGIFTSIEVKRPGWVYKGTPREVAQLAWNNLILSMGGIARFSTGPEGV